jgi:replicative DNA helicase
MVISRASKMGVALGTSNEQVADTISYIKDNDHKRTLIMLSKNIDEKTKAKEVEQNNILQHASDLSFDLSEDTNNKKVDQEQEDQTLIPIREVKKIRVYTRREKVAPKVVRRSVRLSNKK